MNTKTFGIVVVAIAFGFGIGVASSRGTASVDASNRNPAGDSKAIKVEVVGDGVTCYKMHDTYGNAMSCVKVK